MPCHDACQVYLEEVKSPVTIVITCVTCGRQVSGHLQESKAPSHVTVTWEDTYHNFECSPFLLLPPDIVVEHDIICYGISLVSVRVSCPSCVPSQLLAHPHPLAGGVG